ncbi:Uncharacterised protein [Mycobacteroides abscessus subsp. abscessus]|nr:Uncharacterised protein [Mycobacteroides abscessus subsp. abscessus]
MSSSRACAIVIRFVGLGSSMCRSTGSRAPARFIGLICARATLCNMTSELSSTPNGGSPSTIV